MSDLNLGENIWVGVFSAVETICAKAIEHLSETVWGGGVEIFLHPYFRKWKELNWIERCKNDYPKVTISSI